MLQPKSALFKEDEKIIHLVRQEELVNQSDRPGARNHLIAYPYGIDTKVTRIQGQ